MFKYRGKMGPQYYEFLRYNNSRYYHDNLRGTTMVHGITMVVPRPSTAVHTAVYTGTRYYHGNTMNHCSTTKIIVVIPWIIVPQKFVLRSHFTAVLKHGNTVVKFTRYYHGNMTVHCCKGTFCFLFFFAEICCSHFLEHYLAKIN